MPTEDIEILRIQLHAASEDASTLVASTTQAQAAWRPSPGRWSAAQCLEHLALTNRAYLAAFEPAVTTARSRHRLRRGPATPGFFAAQFLKQLEPPVRRGRTLRAPKVIHPRESPPFAAALADFASSQQLIHTFLKTNHDLDLRGIRFVNPFIPALRFSLASGLHIITAHERRHLWQARKAIEAAPA